MAITILILCCLLPPLFFSVHWLLNLRTPERRIQYFVWFYSAVLLVCQISLALLWYRQGDSYVLYENLVQMAHYELSMSFRVDAIALVFGLLTSVLSMIVFRYSFEYLSRESGYFRYFVLVTSLTSALVLISYSENYDSLAMGWEVVGICSVLLIGFFHKHERGAHNSLYALISYRFGDAALLTSIGLMHLHFHSTRFSDVYVGYGQTVLIPFFIILACMPKSAQFPFSSWIKKAVEGPSASTAIFYGALSIHLGPLLLIRSNVMWMDSIWLRGLIVLCGVITTVLSTAQAKTMSDAKSVLVAASQAQVGIIFVEIAFGFQTFAMIHLIGHAGLRTWQLLRASSLLQDFQDSPAIYRLITAPQHKSISHRKYHYMLNGYFIEPTVEYVFVRIFRFFGSVRDSISQSIFLALIGMVATYLLTLSHPDFLWVGLLLVLWFGVRSIATSSIRHSVLLIILSQILQIWFALLCTHAMATVVVFVLLFELPILYALIYWVRRIDSEVALDRHKQYLGLHMLLPSLFPFFVFLSLMICGAPIGMTFFTEDLSFHLVLEYSVLGTLLLILSLGLNAVALMKVAYRIFWGIPIEGLTVKPLTKRERFCMSALIGFFGAFGLMPSQIYRWVEQVFEWFL